MNPGDPATMQVQAVAARCLEKQHIHQDHEVLGFGRGMEGDQASQMTSYLEPVPCAGAFDKRKHGTKTEPWG